MNEFASTFFIVFSLFTTQVSDIHLSEGFTKFLNSKNLISSSSDINEWRKHQAKLLKLKNSVNDNLIIGEVNEFWNNKDYISDINHYGVIDYWAKPIEMIISGGGDCEDYVFGKYFDLIELGFNPEKFQILTTKISSDSTQKHMVLVYLNNDNYYILDNVNKYIKTISERYDLYPDYSFNDSGTYLWLYKKPLKTSESPVKWMNFSNNVKKEFNSFFNPTQLALNEK